MSEVPTRTSKQQDNTGPRLFLCVNKHYKSGAWHELQRKSGADHCVYVLPRPLASQQSINIFAEHYAHCVTNGLTVIVERVQLQWAECSDGCLAAATTGDTSVLFTIVGNICDAMDVATTSTTGRRKRSTSQPATKKQKTTKTDDQLKVII